jgi:conjugal transfer mating pair stabilization protein TraN
VADKKVTVAATTTYSCSRGYTLSGRTCTRRVAPTSTTTYSCDAGYTLSGSNCTRRVAPTSRVVYDCDDAPAGYTLSGTNCVRTTTKPPTRPTIYTCRADYTRTDTADKPTCTQIDIIDATVTTTPRGCDATPPDEPPYQLQEDHIAGTITHTCERTVTVDATITNTYTCPTRYKLNKTTNDKQTKHTCKLNTH